MDEENELWRTRAWYVLHVKPRTEKKVDDFLSAMRVFHYLPLVRKETKIQRRRIVRFLPVFPGYVFTRLFPDERSRILGTKMVVRTIDVSNPRLMIHQLRQVAHAGRLPADLLLVPHFDAGEYVKVISGPLRGVEGQVRRTAHGTSIVLTVDILGQSLEATVNPADLQKL